MKENVIEPDILADLAFYSTEEGGRQSPLPLKRFGCLFVYKGENFDCFLLPGDKHISPGERVVVPIKFLRPYLIKPGLQVGATFKLRDGRIIADGKIIKIFE